MQVIERRCKRGRSVVYPSVDVNELVDDVIKCVGSNELDDNVDAKVRVDDTMEVACR